MAGFRFQVLGFSNSPLAGESENANALSVGGYTCDALAPPPESEIQTPPQGGSFVLV